MTREYPRNPDKDHGKPDPNLHYFSDFVKRQLGSNVTDWTVLDKLNIIPVDTTACMVTLTKDVFGGDENAYHGYVNECFYRANKVSSDPRYLYSAIRDQVVATVGGSWHALDVAVQRQEAFQARWAK